MLSEILENLLGAYVPYATVVDDELVYLDGLAGVDFPWVASAVLLIVVIYSVFRIVRCLIAR